MKRHEYTENINLGFQIAPMIDVVFVIMLFFMVMAGAVKVEHELKIALPSHSGTPEVKTLDELTIAITEDGTVTMNEEEFDTPSDKKLPRLTSDLIKLKKDADARGDKVLITLQTEAQTKYERIIDVLNSLAQAQIANITFTVGTDEL